MKTEPMLLPTSMSTVPVWGMDVGESVTRVTFGRDGFRNKHGSGNKVVRGGLPQTFEEAGWGRSKFQQNSRDLRCMTDESFIISGKGIQ